MAKSKSKGQKVKQEAHDEKEELNMDNEVLSSEQEEEEPENMNNENNNNDSSEAVTEKKKDKKKKEENSNDYLFRIPLLDIKITFAHVMITFIAGFIALTAVLKSSENSFYYESMYDLDQVNYYEVLGVSTRASRREIQKAHREQTRKWHPDRNPNCGDVCAQRMALISEAYKVLSNPDLTKWHNVYGLRVPEAMMKKYLKTNREEF
ncbi:hypothetical protein C9374_004385 [Naegleria lovaniensis]|uniref:J domain-containing protein n=1 Tax=Naegleria lovaniensis TaxID=51637 RepID=A0AA88GMF9_NAELO|nr:uncharacterized protein C9374_004385 [Naegleria lovaniensis]KAG2383714.1 hypothetical protein C9374_004385 [Naegleria lovaniensis]